MKKMAAANSDPTQKPGDVLAIVYLFTFGSRKKPTMGRIQRQPVESRNWLPEIVSFDRRGTPRICSREPHGPKPAENALVLAHECWCVVKWNGQGPHYRPNLFV